MTDTPTTSQAASVAPTEGNMKRSIQMKWFASEEQKAKVAFVFTQDHDPVAASLVLGTIIGEIFAVKRRTGQRADGETFETMMALGDFEAVNYSSGEVITSPNAYLPKYFLETIEDFISVSGDAFKGMDIALEIVLVPTGKSIPVSYEVRPLIARAPTSGVNRMKLALKAANRLHPALPAPVEGKALQLAGPSAEGSEPTPEPDPSDQGPARGAEPEPAAVKGKGRKEPATA